MRLWPEWAERMAQDPPAGMSPLIHRIFARGMGFFVVYLMVTTSLLVLIGVVFLLLVLTGQL